MEIIDAYTVVVTERLRECRDFYGRWFGFEVVFEASWFIFLTSGGEQPVSIAFMSPEHPSSPPEPGPYRGDGAFLTLQVADAAAEHERIVAAGLSPDLPLREEPWGQLRFGVVDPAGMWVDVVQQVEPAPGWWDAYMTGDEVAST